MGAREGLFDVRLGWYMWMYGLSPLTVLAAGVAAIGHKKEPVPGLTRSGRLLHLAPYGRVAA
jgi:hypothetical protein